jgi:hypothetical protein
LSFNPALPTSFPGSFWLLLCLEMKLKGQYHGSTAHPKMRELEKLSANN